MIFLNNKALNFAVLEYERKLALDRVPGPEVMVRAILVEYLTQARFHPLPKKGFARHPDTDRIAALAIGEQLILPIMSGTIIRSRVRTIRKQENPKFSISLIHDTDSIVVTREPDGNVWLRNDLNNKRYRFLAGIPLGHSELWPWTIKRRSIETYVKIGARRILHNNQADWSCRVTTKGMRVVRIS